MNMHMRGASALKRSRHESSAERTTLHLTNRMRVSLRHCELVCFSSRRQHGINRGSVYYGMRVSASPDCVSLVDVQGGALSCPRGLDGRDLPRRDSSVRLSVRPRLDLHVDRRGTRVGIPIITHAVQRQASRGSGRRSELLDCCKQL